MYTDKYTPPYEITDAISNQLVEIGELVGIYHGGLKSASIPHLRKDNKIQTVFSSLAIENNQLSEEQVSALLEGKRVLGKQKDILEVQNAFRVYDMLSDLDPYSEQDFLKAHEVLTENLVFHAGNYRKGEVGVFQGDAVIHMGSPADLVPHLMNQLFTWLKTSRAHPLIKSCVFHYEMVFIHPFEDGNGRIARLWQSNILRLWNPVFEFLPVETLVYENQEDYYKAIQISDHEGNSTAFIEFMLNMISKALKEASVKNFNDVNIDVNPDVNKQDLAERILNLIEQSPKIRIKDIHKQLGISASTVDRRIAELKKAGILIRKGNKRSGEWIVIKHTSQK